MGKDSENLPGPDSIESFVAEQFAIIDQEASQQKAAITFISGVVRDHWDVLRSFIPKEAEEPSEITEALFETVESSLRWIEDKKTANFGGPASVELENNDPSEFKNPSVALEWTDLVPLNDGFPGRDGTYGFIIIPTEEGVRMVDKYRSAQGLETPVEEVGRRNRENFWAVVKKIHQSNR